MPKSHPPYAAEFRQQMVELVRAGRSPTELAEEFGLLGSDHPQLGRTERDRRRQAVAGKGRVDDRRARGAGQAAPPGAPAADGA